MKVRPLLTGTTLALAGWFALASASTLKSPSLPSYQVAQNEQHERHQEQPAHGRKNQNDEWYQGQRGHWYQENNRWQWRGAPPGDQWYQGQRGHWYNSEPNVWQFGNAGLVCNAAGCNCRQGGYLPPNGQGMVNRNNPNVYWACDSHGHNCHWAQRPRC
jgi:hypothetical protein